MPKPSSTEVGENRMQLLELLEGEKKTPAELSSFYAILVNHFIKIAGIPGYPTPERESVVKLLNAIDYDQFASFVKRKYPEENAEV